jgi:UDP-2,4-diacetamido-2,4,6-trideoxy-beta-L-altropyranose hydrolase
VPTSRIAIRCDGSPAIGAGHVTRCGALASALRDRGLEPLFVTRAESSGLSVLGSAGFACEPIPAFGPENALDDRDLEATIAAARKAAVSCMVVDHYGAASWYLAGLREASFALGVIDDVADRDLSAADWILNQNIGATSLSYRVRKDAALLFEPSYALLRPEFALARSGLSRCFSEEDRRVLVTLGGGDTASLCADLLLQLERVSRPLEIRCVITDSVLPETIVQRAQTSPHDVTILRRVENMTEQMTWADVSLNAGGSTCWELLCLGVPMVVVALSSDQRRIPRALEEAGLARRVTSLDDAGDIAEALLATPKKREEMSLRGRVLVDGLGAFRAAASLSDLLLSSTLGLADARG